MFSFFSSVAASISNCRFGFGCRLANSAMAFALTVLCDHSISNSSTLCRHTFEDSSGQICRTHGDDSSQWRSLWLASACRICSTRGTVTCKNEAASCFSAASCGSASFSISARKGTTCPWLFFHNTQQRSASLNKLSRPEASGTSSTLIFNLRPSLSGFLITELSLPRRVQKRRRSEWLFFSRVKSLPKSCLLSLASDSVFAVVTGPASSSSSSLSSISTRTGPVAGACAGSAGSLLSVSFFMSAGASS
mmetsp:Transcript_31593/g.55819  ORF Transcript_31593/g.55819 Transcript_31593/m.55819 type:complete len:249 (-) Transcript_31593:1171-1917(-)